MITKPIPTEPDPVDCEICLKEIPDSVAVNSEALEYVQHYCGMDCYERWKESIAGRQLLLA